MEFISVEKFLKQPKEVQEVFFKWANDNAEDYDLVQDNGEIMLYKDFIERARIEFDSYPLFTEGQIRKFIEDKIGRNIECNYYDCLWKYQITFNEHYRIIRTDEDNLLQAYWKVACEIAKESVEGGL